MIYSKLNRPPSVKEHFSKPSKTETAGYIPARQQVENLLLAGARLDEYRKNQYDFAEGQPVEDGFDVPLVRKPGVDLADIHQEKMRLDIRLQKQEKERREKIETAKKQAKEELQTLRKLQEKGFDPGNTKEST